MKTENNKLMYRKIFYYQRKIMFFLLFGIAGVILSCEEGNELGKNVLPASDSSFHRTMDTTTVYTSTLTGEDSVGKGSQQRMLFGSYNDEVFGEVQAETMTQFYPGSFSFPFDDNDKLDSVVLLLRYPKDTTKFYGDYNAPINLKIYELNQSVKRNQAYNQEDVDYKSGNELYSGEYTSPSVGADTMLRVKLSGSEGSFGKRLRDSTLSSAYDGYSEFNDEFPGLYLKNTKNNSDEGAITYFDQYHEDSKIRLYYYDNDADTAKYFDYTFEKTYAANIFNLDNSGTPVAETITDNSKNDSIAYLQSMGGTRVKIEFPYLDNWEHGDDKRIAINKAFLRITPKENPIEGNYDLPNQLEIFRINRDSIKYPLEEYLRSRSYQYLGEHYDSETGTYTFDITKHVQGIIDDGIKNRGLYLMVKNNNVTAARCRIFGGSHSTNPVKLEISYSLID